MTNLLRFTTRALTLTVLLFSIIWLVGCGGDEDSIAGRVDAGSDNSSYGGELYPSLTESITSSGTGESNMSHTDLDGIFTVGGCTAEGPGKVPSAELPRVSNIDKVYTIDVSRWKISNNQGKNIKATTDGLNAAIEWAHSEGYGTVRLPAGIYLVGEKKNEAYSSALVLPDNIHFNLEQGAVIEMAQNDTRAYCILDIPRGDDVIISGGAIRGDRATHQYVGSSTHEYGHAICVGRQGASQRILIDGMKLTEGTGDGVMINDGPDKFSQDITIRNSHIYNNRRQGISIVGGVNVVVENNDIYDIQGTLPQFGIDIEGTGNLHINENILIRYNKFYRNHGGDYVNNDGRNVWLVNNSMDQSGLQSSQIDGPIVFHSGQNKGGQIISDNLVKITVGSSNGKAGVINYDYGGESKVADIITRNNIIGGGITLLKTSRLLVSENILQGSRLMSDGISCLQLDYNDVNYNGTLPYLFNNTFGIAVGNIANGKSVDFPLSPSKPFSND